jgi:HD superfamily phosphohydrolase
MHVAATMFEALTARATLSPEAKRRFGAALRLAVLCHDLGHMPLSHASESIAPRRALLKLPGWTDTGQAFASHEDFTARILLDSELSRTIAEVYAGVGVTPLDVASLVTGREAPGSSGFRDNGLDWAPLLRALVSGELDADRMDYLLRDSFYTGVNYGRYDVDWVMQNLNAAEHQGRAVLALSRAAVFAFEDFLLSRYHMFLSVYYHHTSVSFDHMLRRYYEEAPGEFEIPADPDAFLTCDDVALLHTLRTSKNRWAQRIVTRRGFKRVVQFTERDEGYDIAQLSTALTEHGIEHYSVESRGVLSKYFDEGASPSLYVLDKDSGRLTEISAYTPLYQRFNGAVRLSRLYVRPDQVAAAQPLISKLTGALDALP